MVTGRPHRRICAGRPGRRHGRHRERRPAPHDEALRRLRQGTGPHAEADPERRRADRCILAVNVIRASDVDREHPATEAGLRPERRRDVLDPECRDAGLPVERRLTAGVVDRDVEDRRSRTAERPSGPKQEVERGPGADPHPMRLVEHDHEVDRGARPLEALLAAVHGHRRRGDPGHRGEPHAQQLRIAAMRRRAARGNEDRREGDDEQERRADPMPGAHGIT